MGVKRNPSPERLSRVDSLLSVFLATFSPTFLLATTAILTTWNDMPAAKRQKQVSESEDEGDGEHISPNIQESDDNDFGDESGSEQSGSGSGSSPDTDDEIADAKRAKSKKTLKRKRRATDALRFGATLQSLLHTDAPSTLPLSLKPSITRQRNDDKLNEKGKKILHVERKEKEERGRIKDVIGGWGGENERALRKVAQRGGEFAGSSSPARMLIIMTLVVKLFNVIQQSQTTAAAAEEDVKAKRGTGKPTLPAPSFAKGKKKGKDKGGVTSASTDGKSTTVPCTFCDPQPVLAPVGRDDFLNSIRSGGFVPKA